MQAHPNLTSIETERQGLFTKLEGAQADYFTANKRYLQCLTTPAASQDGTSLASFNRSRKPDDEANNWTSLLAPADVEGGVYCQYYVHRYDGPAGSGFILGCQVTYDGAIWVYEEHHGPEKRTGPFDEWCEVA